MEVCVFCQIIKKEIPSHQVYEDEYSFAFTDKHPINPGHLLVIPKKHVATFYEMEDDDFSKLMLTVKKLSNAVNKTFNPKKVGLIIAGWDVPHTHVHIVPMHDYHDITSKKMLEGVRSNPTEEELEETATEIRQNLV